MTNKRRSVEFWALDSSTFIHALIVGRLWVLSRDREPLRIPEYIVRVELTTDAHADTAEQARRFVSSGHAAVCRLSLADLDRIAEMKTPRRIGLGEIACAVIAERESGGVLSDDWKGRKWLEANLGVALWESIEDVLLRAAAKGHISEFDLEACEDTLRINRYDCRVRLRDEHLRRRLNQQGAED